MEKLTLSSVEHAFYKAGEVVGAANAMDKIATELRSAATHYRTYGQNADAENAEQSALQPAMDRIAEILETLAAQIETESSTRRKTFSQLIDTALSLRGSISITGRISRAAKGAVNGWRGRTC